MSGLRLTCEKVRAPSSTLKHKSVCLRVYFLSRAQCTNNTSEQSLKVKARNKAKKYYSSLLGYLLAPSPQVISVSGLFPRHPSSYHLI